MPPPPPPRPEHTATHTPKQETRVRLIVEYATPKDRRHPVNDAGWKWRWLVDPFGGFHVAFPCAAPTATAVLDGFLPPVLDKTSGTWNVLDGRGKAVRHARPRSRAAAVTEHTSRTVDILLRGYGTMPQDAVPEAVKRANTLFRDHGGVSVVPVGMTKAAFDFAWNATEQYILAFLPAACCNCGMVEGIGCTCVEDRQTLKPLVLCDRCKQLPTGHPASHLCGYGGAGRRAGHHGGCYVAWCERNSRLAAPEVANAWLTVCKASCAKPGMCRVAPNPFCAPVSRQKAALDPWVGGWSNCAHLAHV